MPPACGRRRDGPTARACTLLAVCLLAASPAAAGAVRRVAAGPSGGRGASPGAGAARGALRIRLQRRPLHRPGRAPPGSLVQLASATGAAGRGRRLGPPPRALVGSVFVGTPPQEFSVAFDTGSGNLLLPGKSCLSAACLSRRTYDPAASATSAPAPAPGARASGAGVAGVAGAAAVLLPVGAGHATGRPRQDAVCLGPGGELCTRAGLVEALELSEEPFGLLPYDGVLGLGLPGASLSAPFNLLGGLARAGALESNRFAVWLATEADGEDAEITLGAVSADRLASPEVVWQPLSRTGAGLWQVTLSDVAADLARLHLCGPAGCQAAFDTGTGAIAGPAKFVEALLAVLNVDAACKNFRSLPMLGFAFGGVTLNIDPSDYVEKTPAGCFHRFLAVDTPAPAGPLVLLGAPFLQRYYSIYDVESLRVGLGLARHVPVPGANESAAQAAARLVVRTAAGALV